MKISDSKYIGITSDGTKTLKKSMKKAATKQKQCKRKQQQYNESYSGHRFSDLSDNFSTKRSRFVNRKPFCKSSRNSNQNFKIQELPRITEVSEVN